MRTEKPRPRQQPREIKRKQAIETSMCSYYGSIKACCTFFARTYQLRKRISICSLAVAKHGPIDETKTEIWYKVDFSRTVKRIGPLVRNCACGANCGGAFLAWYQSNQVQGLPSYGKSPAARLCCFSEAYRAISSCFLASISGPFAA